MTPETRKRKNAGQREARRLKSAGLWRGSLAASRGEAKAVEAPELLSKGEAAPSSAPKLAPSRPSPAKPLGPIARLLLGFGVELRGGLEKW